MFFARPILTIRADGALSHLIHSHLRHFFHLARPHREIAPAFGDENSGDEHRNGDKRHKNFARRRNAAAHFHSRHIFGLNVAARVVRRGGVRSIRVCDVNKSHAANATETAVSANQIQSAVSIQFVTQPIVSTVIYFRFQQKRSIFRHRLRRFFRKRRRVSITLAFFRLAPLARAGGVSVTFGDDAFRARSPEFVENGGRN